MTDSANLYSEQGIRGQIRSINEVDIDGICGTPVAPPYAVQGALGIPEIWRHDGERLWVERLRPDGTYEASETSGVFPFLPMHEVEAFLARCDESDETTWLHGFRDWVRRTLRP